MDHIWILIFVRKCLSKNVDAFTHVRSVNKECKIKRKWCHNAKTAKKIAIRKSIRMCLVGSAKPSSPFPTCPNCQIDDTDTLLLVIGSQLLM